MWSLNAGQNVQCPNADEIIYTLHEREYVEKIEKAYSYASKTLLDLLMDERALMARLRYSIRPQLFKGWIMLSTG